MEDIKYGTQDNSLNTDLPEYKDPDDH